MNTYVLKMVRCFDFAEKTKVKLNKIPQRACYEKLYISHELFVFLLKNIEVGSRELKKYNDPKEVDQFLHLVIMKIDEFENGIPNYPYPYEHEREFLLDLKYLRRVVNSLLV